MHHGKSLNGRKANIQKRIKETLRVQAVNPHTIDYILLHGDAVLGSSYCLKAQAYSLMFLIRL